MINGGFTIDDVPALDIKIIMTKESERPIAPSTVDRLLSIPGRNGMQDFGADVTARYFNLECRVITRNHIELQDAIERIAAVLLDGYGRPKTVKLVFDARPDRYFLVRYSGSLSIDRLFGFGTFTLPFIAFDPFARSLKSTEDVILDSDILLDSDVRLDDGYSYRVTGSSSVIEINNLGTLIANPQIVLDGSLTSLSISCNGKTFGYTEAFTNQQIIIDGEWMTVKNGAVNKLYAMSGHFIDLLPGVNKVTIGGTGLNCMVSFVFKPKYL